MLNDLAWRKAATFLILSAESSPAEQARVEQLAKLFRDYAREAPFESPPHGYLAKEPLKIEHGIDYENRSVGCAYCGAQMPHAPWPTNSDSIFHRPRCGKCGSPMTYPNGPT